MRVTPTAGARIVAHCFPPDRREAKAWLWNAIVRLRQAGWHRPFKSLTFAVAKQLGPVRPDAAMLAMVGAAEVDRLRRELRDAQRHTEAPVVIDVPSSPYPDLIGPAEATEGATLYRGEAMRVVDLTITEGGQCST